MKCKKPNCHGVVENGVCTKCGAKSDAPAANEEAKKDKESKVKEPGTASPKSAAEVQSKAASDDKQKAADGKKEPLAPEKHPEKKEAHKETEPKKGGHKEEQAAKASSEKVEKDGKSATKQSELARRVEQAESAKHEVAEKHNKFEPTSTSGVVTPPPMAGGQAEPKAEAKSEPKSVAKSEPKSEAKVEPKPEPAPEPKPESKTEPETKPETKPKSEPKPEPTSESKLETKSDASKINALDSGTARPMEHTTAKKSNTEERKKIESTIQSNLVPEPTRERLNLKDVNLEDTAAYRNIIVTVREILEPREVAPTREDLYHASRALRHVMPYNFDAWRLHADLLLTAIRQLETRQLQPDPNFTLMAIPLREDDLRDAAEQALRQCAHFADNEQQKIELIDEANSVRRLTWF